MKIVYQKTSKNVYHGGIFISFEALSIAPIFICLFLTGMVLGLSTNSITHYIMYFVTAVAGIFYTISYNKHILNIGGFRCSGIENYLLYIAKSKQRELIGEHEMDLITIEKKYLKRFYNECLIYLDGYDGYNKAIAQNHKWLKGSVEDCLRRLNQIKIEEDLNLY